MIIIGDVHGKFDEYARLISEHDYSLQLGDFGFDYEQILPRVDAERHRIIAGNHEHYETCFSYPHFLGDFGPVPNIPNSFFVRGGYSIDKHRRTQGVDWFPQEELEYAAALQALEEYKRVKPRYVFSHESPALINRYIIETFGGLYLEPSFTSQLLSYFFDYHQPELWIFAHWHYKWSRQVGNTSFICLDELDTYSM
jgi:hypothetical protein